MGRKLETIEQILDPSAEVVIERQGKFLAVTGGKEEIERFIRNHCRFCEGNDDQSMRVDNRGGVFQFNCLPVGKRVVNKFCAGQA